MSDIAQIIAVALIILAMGFSASAIRAKDHAISKWFMCWSIILALMVF